MIRIHEKDINTPEWYDTYVWPQFEAGFFDQIRMRATLRNAKSYDCICDLGAGMFSFAEYAITYQYPPHVEGYALDFSRFAKEKTLERCPQLHYEVGDVLSAPWGNGVFDLVGAGEVIEHMEHPELLVQEMARLCKPGGYLVISTVDPDCENAQKMQYPEHLWKFTPAELCEMFRPYGDPLYDLVGDYHMVHTRRR